MLIQAILSQDNNVILYRKELNQLTGSVTATLFLSQVIYWWQKNGRKPFYKFRTACKHADYKEGDSWCEELGFSEKELDYAIAAVCEKTNNTRKDAKESLKQNLVKPYVTSHTSIDRKTYYTLNESLLENDLRELYIRLHNLQSSDYVIPETEITIHTKRRLDYTENTTENTNNSFALQQNSNFSLPSRQNEKKETPTPQSPPPPFAEATQKFKLFFCDVFYPQHNEGLKYSFKKGKDGTHLKNIIQQMVGQIKNKGKEANDDSVFEALKTCLENFNKEDFSWVKGEVNLGLMDCKFNDFIINAKKNIKAKINPQPIPQKPSSTMYGDKRDKEDIERENILNDKTLSKEEKQQKLYELSMKKSNHETNTKK